jgi:hypothetical protein
LDHFRHTAGEQWGYATEISSGSEPNPDKIRPITQMRPPQNRKDV